MRKIFSVLAVSSLFIACNDNSVVPNLANLEAQGDLIGVWEYDSYEQINDSTYVDIYRKVKRIAGDQAGITFKSNGIFVSKQNAGWCGTPPITYKEYDGTYNVGSKNILDINSTYWGGKMSYKAEVIELTNRKLKIRPFGYEYDEPY